MITALTNQVSGEPRAAHDRGPVDSETSRGDRFPRSRPRQVARVDHQSHVCGGEATCVAFLFPVGRHTSLPRLRPKRGFGSCLDAAPLAPYCVTRAVLSLIMLR